MAKQLTRYSIGSIAAALTVFFASKNIEWNNSISQIDFRIALHLTCILLALLVLGANILGIVVSVQQGMDDSIPLAFEQISEKHASEVVKMCQQYAELGCYQKSVAEQGRILLRGEYREMQKYSENYENMQAYEALKRPLS